MTAACGPGIHEKPALEYMPDMANADSVKAQEEAMRVPPAGTRPIGFDPYPYRADQGEMASLITNPLPVNRKTLAQGKKMYDTYCIVCHGRRGKGNGFIVPKFPMPPSLHSEKVANWEDGRLFHVITRGQNLMPSYASQIEPRDRWAIIHYVRALERASNPTPEDLEVFRKGLK